jgi:Tfp pilus assembly protein PilN
MSNINLLEDKNKGDLSRKDSFRAMRFGTIGLLFVVSASSIILFILISLSPLPSLRAQERTDIATLSANHTDMAKLFYIKERTTVIESVLSKRLSYDSVLEDIQSKLPNGVEMESIKLEKNTLSIIVSSKSLELLNTFTTSLTNEVNEKKNFSKITLSSLSLEEEKGYLTTLTLVML